MATISIWHTIETPKNPLDGLRKPYGNDRHRKTHRNNKNIKL